jgi:starch synthase
MNGIDTQEWNPETDSHLPEGVRYSASTVTSGKAAAKALFQERYGLSIDADIPLVGMIGRLAPQKGVDVVLAALPALLASKNASAAPAGTGLPHWCGQQQSSHQLTILGSG